MNRTQDVTAAFVLGAMAGGVAALLWAPEKGEVTRKRLKDGARELVKRGEAFTGEIRGAAAEAIKAARHQTRNQGKLLTGYRREALAGAERSAV